MNLELNLKERLFLANQYDILSRLTSNEHESRNYVNLRDIFISGYTRSYSDAISFFDEELNEDGCQFVVAVLEMYRSLYYSRLNNPDAVEEIDEKNVLFKGFDANDPTQVKYYGYYQFLVEQQGKWKEIKEFIQEGKIEDYNSHGFGPTMIKLHEMLDNWERIKADNNNPGSNLTLDEIKRILN